MSRRRRGVDFGHVQIDVLCPRGHRVGIVGQFVAPDPRQGYFTGGGVRFEDHERGGKVRGTCPNCQADVEIRWSRLHARLESNALSGRHTDEMRPDEQTDTQP